MKNLAPNKISLTRIILHSFLLLEVSSCKEVSVTTEGHTISEQQIDFLEKKMALLENRISKIEEKLSENSTSSSPTDQNSNQAILNNIIFKVDVGLKDDPTIGLKNDSSTLPNVIILLYTDLICKNCQIFINETLPSIKDWVLLHEDSQLKIRDFPISTETENISRKASIASNCIGLKGDYWSYIPLLKKTPTQVEDLIDLSGTINGTDYESFKSCLFSDNFNAEIELDKDSGKQLGVRGVPSLYIGALKSQNTYSGILIRGNQPVDTIISNMEKIYNAKNASSK